MGQPGDVRHEPETAADRNGVRRVRKALSWMSPGSPGHSGRIRGASSTSVIVGHQLAHPGRLPHRAGRLELDRVWLDVQDWRSVDGVEPLHVELYAGYFE